MSPRAWFRGLPLAALFAGGDDGPVGVTELTGRLCQGFGQC